MRYLEVIFYNISYDIKTLCPIPEFYIFWHRQRVFFFVKYITESVLRFRIIPFSPSLQVFSFLPCILSDFFLFLP